MHPNSESIVDVKQDLRCEADRDRLCVFYRFNYEILVTKSLRKIIQKKETRVLKLSEAREKSVPKTKTKQNKNKNKKLHRSNQKDR